MAFASRQLGFADARGLAVRRELQALAVQVIAGRNDPVQGHLVGSQRFATYLESLFGRQEIVVARLGAQHLVQP